MKFNPSDQAFLSTERYGTRVEPIYSGALSFMRRRYSRDLDGIDIAVTGIPLDLATSHRPGARFGPAAIRAASANLAWGPPWPWGFDPFDRLAVVDYGDCAFDHGRPAGIPGAIEDHAAEILRGGAEVLALGGDHFVALPLLRAHVAHLGQPLALVHFDAHSDTWQDEDGRVDHGTMFFHAVREGLIVPERSVQVGIRTHNSDPLGIAVLDAAFVHERGVEETVAFIRDRVGDHPAYLTFDIDCLDPAFAPGTGTPVAGGLSTYQAQAILRRLGTVGFVGMDLVEVAPAYDHAETTALAAASIAMDYLALRASQPPRGER